MWTMPLFGSSGTLGDTQVKIPRYTDCSGIDPPAFNLASIKTSGYFNLDSCDFTTLAVFKGFTMATSDDVFQQCSTQCLGKINPTVEPTTSGGVAPTCLITQYVEPSALKKYKTSEIRTSKEPAGDLGNFSHSSILNFLFKYIHDLTATQI
jgi:hypothetical protein